MQINKSRHTNTADRICLINDSFPPVIDGVSNAVVNYARILSQHYCYTVVATPYYPNANDESLPFPVIRYPSLNTSKQVGYRAGMPFSSEVLSNLEKCQFNLIHSHCPITSMMMARMLRERIDAPVVLTYHTKYDIDISNAIHGKVFQEEALLLLKRNIQSADEVWTVSEGAGENLRKIGYCGSYRVMSNGVDLPKGRVSEKEIHDATCGYDLPDDTPVFLFVGRMMWYKGIRIILDALKKCKDAGMPFRMVFIGGGSDCDSIQKYTEELNLEDCVLFINPIRDRELIRAWYSRSDLFLFPSTFDTNGLVVREAAACSLASVLVKGSCAAEGVEDGLSGFLIDEDAASLATLLQSLQFEPWKMKEVGRRAQEKLYISWDDAVKNAYERYGEVIENYRSGYYMHKDQISDELFKRFSDALSFTSDRKKDKEYLISALQDNRERMTTLFQQETKKLDEVIEELFSLFNSKE